MPGSENSIMIMFYVYVLESQCHDRMYVGFASQLQQRFAEHNHGLVFSTKPYRPWQLIHYEAYLSEKDARRRERYLKTSQGMRLLKRMLKEYFYDQKTNRISTARYVS